ncbi:MAG: hypothetical protein IKF64_02445 [Eubacterium sp.]|nr:hypothetical protein [Eubacterium sp.]
MMHIKSALSAILLTSVIVFLIIMSPAAKEGALNGIQLCEGIIIPSLLPILIITNIILKSRAADVFEKLFGRLFEAVLRLPKSAVIPILFGLVSGYPAGAVLTAEQYRAGAITSDEARRIMHFNMCGGAAFIVSAVGGFYGSAKIGFALYIINILSSVIIAFASAPFCKKAERKARSGSALSFSSALCTAAESSSKSVILMSAYIILFAAIMKVLPLPDALYPLFEITGGIFGGEKIPLPYCAFFLQFGGLCIHFQLIGLLGEMKIKYIDFLVFRVLSAIISFVICKGYIALFPDSVQVFYNTNEAMSFQFTETGTAFGILAMLGCGALVLDIENRKIKL